MRPLRALLVLGLLLGVWTSWRVQAAHGEFAALLRQHRGPLLAAAEHTRPGRPPARIAFRTVAWPGVLAGRQANRPSRRARRLRLPEHPAFADANPAAATASAPAAGREAYADASAPSAYALAVQAYADLDRGARRAAAREFAAALRTDGAHPNAALWRRELGRLRRRWSFDAYSLIRKGDGATGASAAPLLGGGQSGLRLGYVLNPLSRRPVQLFTRLNVAQDWLDIDGRSAQAAAGIGWRPLGRTGPDLEVERLIGLGPNARDAFAARIAGGASGRAGALPIHLSAYGEAGVVGLHRGDTYVGGQAYALAPVAGRDGGAGVRLSFGAGAWGSVQHAGGRTASRFEVGPSLQASLPAGGGALEARLEYRARIAGDAAPGSGAALTLVTRF